MIYTAHRTINGLIVYKLNGKRIAKKSIPADILKKIPPPESPTVGLNQSDEISTIYAPGYSFLFTAGGKSKLYYYNGKRIRKAEIPNDVDIVNQQQYWSKLWEEELKRFKERFCNQKSPRPKHEEQVPKDEKSSPRTNSKTCGESPPKCHKRTEYTEEKYYVDLTPQELLRRENIHSRGDWKKWMLINHPDKNPNTDPQLVALVNVAVDIVHPI